MSSRPAIIALLLCIVLAIGAYFVIKPSGSGAGGGGASGADERLTTTDLATVTAFTVQVPPGAPQVTEKAADGTWQWKAKPTDERRYALDESTLRAFFRKLAESKTVASPPSGQPLSDKPAPVTLTLRAKAGDTVIRLAPRALGGQVLADIKEPTGKARTVVIGEDLLTLLTSPGPSAWRDTRALPVDAALAARITFTDGSGTKGFGLARHGGQGRYVLTPPAPVSAPADPDVVNTVVRTINGLTIAKFFDDDAQLTPKATGLDAPTGVLTLEFDDRSVDPQTQQAVVTTRTHKLVLGQPADAGGTTLFASPDGGKTVFSVVATPLAGLTGPPASLVARNPSPVPTADVGVIEFVSTDGKRSVRLSRDSSTGTARWFEAVDGAPPVAQSAEETQGCELVLSSLTTSFADITSLDPLKDAKLVATASLTTPSGQPLERFDLLMTPAGGVVVATVGTGKSGTVYRLIGRPPAALVSRLNRLQR